MAKIFYELRQNKNNLSKIFGKWFAHSKTVETLNTRKLAQHISEHGSIYTPDVVYGVLEKFRSCLIEMLLDSKRVKIDGLGTFFTTIENEKGGAISEEKFSVNTNLKALHIRFLPEQEQEMNISSREFFKKAEFINIDTLKGGGPSAGSGTVENGGSGSSTGSETVNEGGNGNSGGSGIIPTPSDPEDDYPEGGN
jgi:predicted histone-like DNA-binding protein